MVNGFDIKAVFLIHYRKIMHLRKKTKISRPGFSLIDAVLSIFVVTIMASLLASLGNVRLVDRTVALRVQAATLADEEINILRGLDPTTISTQTNGSFKSILYNAGSWSITTDAANLDAVSSPCPPSTVSKHCGTNVVSLAKATGFSGTASGRLLFPAGTYQDATLQANWKVVTDSAAGWSVGYLLRMVDPSNGYRFRVADTATDLDTGKAGTQNVILEKVSSGVVTTLFSPAGSVTFSTGAWHNLKIILGTSSGNATIAMYIDGNQQGSGAVTDSTSPFTSGPAALLGWNGVHAEVDDVQTTVGAISDSWTFESSTALPAAWTRLGVNDLPNNTATVFDDNGTLTIAAYPTSGSVGLKKATVTITWAQPNGTGSYSTSALLGNSGLGL